MPQQFLQARTTTTRTTKKKPPFWNRNQQQQQQQQQPEEETRKDTHHRHGPRSVVVRRRCVMMIGVLSALLLMGNRLVPVPPPWTPNHETRSSTTTSRQESRGTQLHDNHHPPPNAVMQGLLARSRSNTNNQPRILKRMYYCGYKYEFLRYVFPDYVFLATQPWTLKMTTEPTTTTNTTTNTTYTYQNLLIIGMHGEYLNCPHPDVVAVFPGTILYINPEPIGDAIRTTKNVQTDAQTLQRLQQHTLFQLGPYPTTHTKNNNNRNSSTSIEDYHPHHSMLLYHTVNHILETFYRPSPALLEIMARTQANYYDAQITTTKTSSSAAAATAGISSTALLPPLPPPKPKPTDEHAWTQLIHGFPTRSTGQPPAVEDEADEKRINAIVYLSRNCQEHRQHAAQVLATTFQNISIGEHEIRLLRQQPTTTSSSASSAASFVHYGGACQIPNGIPVPSIITDQYKNKNNNKKANNNKEDVLGRNNFRQNYQTLYTEYKYCLVMENTYQPGYVTEKLIQALLGGCLPIYSGPQDDMRHLVDPALYIYYNRTDPMTALDELRRLEYTGPDGQREYHRRRALLRTRSLLWNTPQQQKTTAGMTTTDQVLHNEYFSYIPDIGNGQLYTKLHTMMNLE